MPRDASVPSFCSWVAGAREAAALLHIQFATDGCTVKLRAGLRGASPSPADPIAVAEKPKNFDWPPRERFRPFSSA